MNIQTNLCVLASNCPSNFVGLTKLFYFISNLIITTIGVNSIDNGSNGNICNVACP